MKLVQTIVNARDPISRRTYSVHRQRGHIWKPVKLGVGTWCALLVTHIIPLIHANTFHVNIYTKGIKNGCPCIVEIRGTQGCALVGDPARAVGECRDVAKAQP